MNHGIQLPDRSPVVTEAEEAWLTFLRDLHQGRVREPTLAAVQALQQALELRK